MPSFNSHYPNSWRWSTGLCSNCEAATTTSSTTTTPKPSPSPRHLLQNLLLPQKTHLHGQPIQPRSNFPLRRHRGRILCTQRHRLGLGLENFGPCGSALGRLGSVGGLGPFAGADGVGAGLTGGRRRLLVESSFFVPNWPLFFSNNNLQCIMQPSNSTLSHHNRRIQIPLTRAQQRTRIAQKRNSQNHYQFRFLGRLSRRHHRALSAQLLGAR